MSIVASEDMFAHTFWVSKMTQSEKVTAKADDPCSVPETSIVVGDDGI